MRFMSIILAIIWLALSKPLALPYMKEPIFKGGQPGGFALWVNERLEYPSDALKEKAEGCVMLRFTVTENGRVDDIRVLRSCHPSLDSAAVRVVSASPKWRPAYRNGKPVSYIFNFPVDFKITDR